MLRDVGLLLLIMSFATSLYSGIAFFTSYFTKQKQLFFSARFANLSTTTLCLLSSLLLGVLFFSDDFSAFYVYKNSSLDLPLYYKISAFWSSLEGSHLLWTLLLAIFSSISLWSYKQENEELIPIVGSFLQLVLSWMIFLAVSYSNPFEPLFPAAENGKGMNELLQNYYMN